MMDIGLHCRACDRPLYQDDDPELCRYCMSVVLQYNRDLFTEDDGDEIEWIDNLITEEDYV